MRQERDKDVVERLSNREGILHSVLSLTHKSDRSVCCCLEMDKLIKTNFQGCNYQSGFWESLNVFEVISGMRLVQFQFKWKENIRRGEFNGGSSFVACKAPAMNHDVHRSCSARAFFFAYINLHLSLP